LARLKAGETVQAGWTPAKLVSRKDTQGFAAPEIAEIFKVDAAKLPGYAGVESQRGAFVLLKVSRTIDAEETDAARREAAADELRQVIAQEQSNAYVAYLKSKADVKIRLERIEQKQ